MFDVVERFIMLGFPATLFVKLASVPMNVVGFLNVLTELWSVLSIVVSEFHCDILLLFAVCWLAKLVAGCLVSETN